MRINIKKLWSKIVGYNLFKKIWPLKLSTTIYLKNLSSTKAIKEDIPPIPKLANIVSDLFHLHI